MIQIPKIIHYCWFGKHNIPKQLQIYIKGWHKKMPNYRFICWSENNFNWKNIPFTEKEYKRHNWAFVSDYVRLYVLYKYGGIYLDTDVEVLKSLDSLCNNKSFMGLENWNSINTGLICGSIRHEINIKNILKLYNYIGQKSCNKLTNYYNTVNIVTSYFRRLGFRYKNKEQVVNGCHIYPTSYFCPKQYDSNKLKLASNSYTIHHYSATWVKQSLNKTVIRHIKEANLVKRIIGPTLYRKLYKYYLCVKK